MGSGWAVVVTVVGCASITGLLALLARYLGIWTWALAYLRAAREEKVQLCRSQRTTSTRSYLLENDLDWIGLWPRTGSYKRFTNLDDPTSVAGGSVDDPARPDALDQPDLPPQPLRPAPAPPPRMAGWTESGEGSPSPASSVGMGIETPPEPSRPAPVLDRRDSSRSLTGRISRRDSSKELLVSSQQGSPKRPSTNPFRASWVPPDETSEESFAQNSFGVVTGSSPGAATGSHSIEGFPDPRESRVQTERMSSQASLAPATFEGSTWDTFTPARPRGVEAENSKLALMNGSEERVAAGSSVLGDIFSGSGKATASGVGKAPYETFSFSTAVCSAGKISQDNFSTLSTSGTENTLYDTSSFLAASSGAGKASYDTFSTTLDNLGKTSYNTFSLGNYDVQKDNLNDNSEPRDDVFVDISEDNICNLNTLGGNIRDSKNFENSNRTNDKVLEGGTLNFSVNTLDQSFLAVNDIKLRPDNNISSGTNIPQMEVASSEVTSVEGQVTSDPGGRSYEVPATPPNTATYPQSPRSPHIASRLAEVEARMRQLGASTERDVSQDWWPSDAPSSSAAGVEGHDGGKGGRNPFVVQVGGREDPRGLGSVEEEEEVFLLHDAVDEAPHRTHTTSASRRGESAGVESAGVESAGVEYEEDASARRVREYIASLSARLRQIPDQEEVARASPDYIDTPPTSATPPKMSHDASDTSTGGPHALYGSTPPTTATLRNLYSSRRASADVSPAPPTVFTLSISRRLSLDTPPSSAGLVTATPPNSASSQLTFGDTPPSSAGFSSTPPSSAGLAGSFEAGQTLKRAMSCDSVSSDTSVTLGGLEDTCGQVTGHLTVQLIYDR